MPMWSVGDYIESWLIGQLVKYLPLLAFLTLIFIACIVIGCKPSVAWDFTVALWDIIKLSMMNAFTLVRNAIISHLLDSIRNML